MADMPDDPEPEPEPEGKRRRSTPRASAAAAAAAGYSAMKNKSKDLLAAIPGSPRATAAVSGAGSSVMRLFVRPAQPRILILITLNPWYSGGFRVEVATARVYMQDVLVS